MAKLNFKYATMNSGKTLDLIRTAYNYEENGYKILVLKPKIDTKGANKIVSRIGIERKIDYFIDNISIIEMLREELAFVKCIFVDEAQFLKKEQVEELFFISKLLDVDVICYGLRTNFQTEAFEGSMRLLELADELEELKTMCKCGNIARFAGRKVNGEFTQDGKEIEIDNQENISYEPLCGKCYLIKVKRM